MIYEEKYFGHQNHFKHRIRFCSLDFYLPLPRARFAFLANILIIHWLRREKCLTAPQAKGRRPCRNEKPLADRRSGAPVRIIAPGRY